MFPLIFYAEKIVSRVRGPRSAIKRPRFTDKRDIIPTPGSWVVGGASNRGKARYLKKSGM